MANFGDDLLKLLRLHQQTQVELSDWVSGQIEEELSPSGVREQFRKARERETEAYAYPHLEHIISFFKHKQCFPTANRLQTIFVAQCHQRGLIYDVSVPGQHKELLDGIRFPHLMADGSLLRRWRSLISEGDYALFRMSLVLFYRYTESYLHAPTRKGMAIDLARAAITYGDYTDAYIVAKRYELAYKRRIKQHADEGKSRSLLRMYESDTYDLIRSLQIQASAFSQLMFFAPYDASKALFAEAHTLLDRLKDEEWISEDSYSILHVQHLVRKLRTMTRAVWSGTIDRPDAEELNDLADQIVTRFDLIRKNKDLSYIAADTVARAYALGSRTQVEILRAIQWEKYAEEISGAMQLESKQPSKLREYRRLVTEFLVTCKQGHISKGPTTSVNRDLKRQLSYLVQVFGVDEMRHSKLTLLALKQFSLLDMPEGWVQIPDPDLLLNNFIDAHFVEPLKLSTLQSLHRKVREFQEIYFLVDKDSDDHQICMNHLGR